MVVISRHNDSISIQGHAGYAAIGQDIVCAAVSTLTQALVLSLEELTQDEIKADLTPGNSVIQYKNLSSSGKLLLDSFLLSVKAVASAYPAHVVVKIDN